MFSGSALFLAVKFRVCFMSFSFQLFISKRSRFGSFWGYKSAVCRGKVLERLALFDAVSFITFLFNWMLSRSLFVWLGSVYWVKCAYKATAGRNKNTLSPSFPWGPCGKHTKTNFQRGRSPTTKLYQEIVMLPFHSSFFAIKLSSKMKQLIEQSECKFFLTSASKRGYLGKYVATTEFAGMFCCTVKSLDVMLLPLNNVPCTNLHWKGLYRVQWCVFYHLIGLEKKTNGNQSTSPFLLNLIVLK